MEIRPRQNHPVSRYLVGNFIVVNIFLAVLLSNFEMAVDEQHGTIFESLEESNELVLSVRSAAASARRVFVMVRLRARSSKACRWCPSRAQTAWNHSSTRVGRQTVQLRAKPDTRRAHRREKRCLGARRGTT